MMMAPRNDKNKSNSLAIVIFKKCVVYEEFKVRWKGLGGGGFP